MHTAQQEIAILASQVAARLELEKSLGVMHLPISLEVQNIYPATVPPHIHQPDHRVVDILTTAADVTSVNTAPAPTTPVITAPAISESPLEPVAAIITPPEPVKQQQPRHTGSEQKLEAIKPWVSKALKCEDCSLCKSRKQVVFGEGDLDTDLMFVDLYPGREESDTGRPFTGQAGEFLTNIIEKGIKRSRGSVYLTSLIKCRPPGSRNPREEELSACRNYFDQQLQIIKPKVIVAVGENTGNALTGQKLSVEQIRGQWYEYNGVPLITIYHTSFLRRQRKIHGGKNHYDATTWQDIQLAMRRLA